MEEKTENKIADKIGITLSTSAKPADVKTGIDTSLLSTSDFPINSDNSPNLKRVAGERRKRRYTDWKKKYFTARGWNLIMFTAVFLMSLLVFSVLRGNHTLQQELSQVQKIK